MSAIYTQYGIYFESVFVFISLALTVIFVIATKISKEERVKKSLLLTSLSLLLLIALGNQTFFYGLLIDELNLTTNNILLVLIFYSALIFLVQTVYLLRKIVTLPKKQINDSIN